MTLQIEPLNEVCGATATGVDLREPLDATTIGEIRSAWLEHLVLIFPEQPLTDDDLERFANYFGEFGHDPYFAPIDGHEHIAAICRRADEKAPLFAENWHTDWSFQAIPPDGTFLFGITIPPVGGNTGFSNQHLAWEQMPDDLRDKIKDLTAIHSAGVAYAPDGTYGEKEKDSDRSMNILYSEDAHNTQTHPLIRKHPETKREAIYSSLGYIIGFEELPEEEAKPLLLELYQWQTREEFQYQHQWQENMLVMWDNRSLLHRVNGGFDGYDRMLHRVTIAGTEF